MEKSMRDAEQGRTPEISAPILPPKMPELPPEAQPFSAGLREKVLAFFMYIPAYLYVCSGWDGSAMFLVFCALFLAMTEWRFWEQPRSAESWVWLGCLLVVALSEPFGRNRVWGELRVLFLHAFAIYWVLCRSGRLAGGASSHLLPLDVLHGVIVFPFRHFFLRIRTVAYTLTHLRRGEQKRSLPVTLAAAAALLLSLMLLTFAVRELSGADAVFHAAVGGLLTALTPQVSALTLLNLALSLPVGAYLFGLIAGTGREPVESIRARGAEIEAGLETLRKVPAALWLAVLGIFAAIYFAFFALQASYLFGAFTRSVPEGYTVAEYARQGFFSLCRVMAVNFALLWLVTRTCDRRAEHWLARRVLSTVLLGQSVAFAVIAASKLLLYISCFGFTPLRLQSCWLIVVLLAGCVCALRTLWTGKTSFRGWMLFSGVTLALLHLY